MSVTTLFRSRLSEAPATTFLRTPTRSLSLSETDDLVRSLAVGLADIGVGSGEVVAMLVPNSVEFVLIWFALSELGACAALINPALSGPVLGTVLERSGSKVVIAGRRAAQAVRALEGEQASQRTLVVVDEEDRLDVPMGKLHHGEGELVLTDLLGDPGKHRSAPQLPDGLGLLLYTSGTSGSTPSACMYSNDYILNQARVAVDWFDLTASDTFFAALPMVHVVGSTLGTVPCLLTGATFAPARFRAETFWENLCEVDGTIFPFVGVTLTELWKRPPGPLDANNSARLGFGVPIPSWVRGFEERFGVRLVTGYGLNEAAVATFNKGPVAPGVQQSGRARAGIDIAIVDELDYAVEPGSIGEIVIRPTRPREIMDGYYNEPERTVASFRNLWFHTGDLGLLDREGVLYFEGRKKDSVRRKGENISPLQVEEAILTHPDIVECAVFGVPAETLEEDLMAVVVPRAGIEVDYEELFMFCAKVLPTFMVPDYLRVSSSSLPRSGSNKIEKYRLADEGVTKDTVRRPNATSHPQIGEGGELTN